MGKLLTSMSIMIVLGCSYNGNANDIIDNLLSKDEKTIQLGLFQYTEASDDFRMKNIGYLIELTKNSNINIRHAAIGVIGNSFLDYDRKAEEVIQPSFRIKRIIFDNNAKAAANKVIPELIKNLNDPDHYIVQISIISLSYIGSLAVDSVQPLIKIIKKNDKELRINAIKALGNIGDNSTDVISILEHIVKTGDHHESDIASKALSAIKEYVQSSKK